MFSRAKPRPRQDLVCPFCHDHVSGATVACAREGCGAVYHRACWEELLPSYGGCAVFGCGSGPASGPPGESELDAGPIILFGGVLLVGGGLFFPPAGILPGIALWLGGSLYIVWRWIRDAWRARRRIGEKPA